MTDQPPQDLRVENTLLRAQLWMTARRLKDYLDAPATKLDQESGETLQITVPASVRDSAAETLAKAQAMLKEPEQGLAV